ncbi:hypothetical protein Tco_0431196 [Tanacetum coccineum]
MGLWYPKDNAMALIAYADADHAGCQGHKKKYFGDYGSVSFLGNISMVGLTKKTEKHCDYRQTEAEYIANVWLMLQPAFLMRNDVIINTAVPGHTNHESQETEYKSLLVLIYGFPTVNENLLVKYLYVVQNDEDSLTFLIDLCDTSGPLSQASNDKLRKSRIDIPWGMFYRENVDYPSLIWEDIAYQIVNDGEEKSQGCKYAISSIHKEPLIRRKTSRRKVVKKKASISVDDNIIPEQIALE